MSQILDGKDDVHEVHPSSHSQLTTAKRAFSSSVFAGSFR